MVRLRETETGGQKQAEGRADRDTETEEELVNKSLPSERVHGWEDVAILLFLNPQIYISQCPNVIQKLLKTL